MSLRGYKSALEQEYATPDLFSIGHWHGEISSNVTFAYCTKVCIDVAVLRGRPLTPFSFFFSSRKLAEMGYKGKNVRIFKGRLTQSTMEASVERKRTPLGA